MEGDGAVSVSGKEAVDAVVVDDLLTEDEKIERFFTLIRNYKEARERQRIELDRASEDEDQKRRKRNRTVETEDRNVLSWIPAFKSEDFTDNSRIRYHRSPASFNDLDGGDRMRRPDDQPPPEANGGGLDLNLRL